MFDSREINWLADLLSTTADSEILPRFRRLDSSDIRQKTSAADLVTEADVLSEKVITAALRERFPQAMIVGEEACSDNPALLDGLSTADLAFTIDPVDGTFNFASGVPLFGVMLSVNIKGETVAGLIYDPMGRDWLIGVKGAGSYIRREDGSEHKVHVAKAPPLEEMTGSVSWQYLPEPDRSLVAGNQAKFLSHLGYRCAAHEYRVIATGSAHFAVYNKLMPWDHLPGNLIQQEAGGYTARLDGSAYKPGHVDGGLIIAPDKDSWHAIKQVLWQK